MLSTQHLHERVDVLLIPDDVYFVERLNRRLRAGLTIRQAAETVGICRHTLMNYENEGAKGNNRYMSTQRFSKF